VQSAGNIKKQMRTASNAMVAIAIKVSAPVRAATVAMFRVAMDVLTTACETMGRLTTTKMANDKVPTVMAFF